MIRRKALEPAMILTAWLLAAQGAWGAEAMVVHVSVRGNDRWSGRLAEPNANHSDGPVATLTGARDALRKARSGGAGGSAIVRIGGGMYRMDRPLVLDPTDSGSADAPVIYEAAAGQRPILSGGRVISGWKQNGDVWETHLPDVQQGRWHFRQLFVNGQRRRVARSPNQGYFRIAELIPGPMDPTAKRAIARHKFKFAPGDLKPCELLGDANIVLMHSWETSIHPIKSIDHTTSTVEFVAPLKEWWTIGWWEEKQRYFVENARELLDAPGEWYLNRQTGILAYRPMPGESIDQVEVVAPALTELVRFAGNADQGRFVEHITLRGLTFHHADWQLDPNGNSSTQAAVEVPAAIMADGARNCAIKQCEVAHVGTYGIWLRRGNRECAIQANRLFDLGAGGIRVGEAARSRTDAGESSHNLVDNNHIHDGGHVYPAGIGVWVAQSSHNTISHNDIHNLLYSGISIGWNWDDAPNRTHHNTIEFNHVHDLVHGQLSDAGLIYCLGASPGSVIRNNVFHDIQPYEKPAFGWGVYLDATCSGYLVENNIVYNTRSGGLMYSNGGHEHIVRNNIFALHRDHTLWPYWEKRPNTFTGNIVYMNSGEFFVPFTEASFKDRLSASQSLGTWDQNIYWHADGPAKLRFYGRTFAEWRKLGLDEHSQIADPQFVDPAAFDFRLKEGSAALKMGFNPIDASKAGLYGDPAWIAEPKATGKTNPNARR